MKYSQITELFEAKLLKSEISIYHCLCKSKYCNNGRR